MTPPDLATAALAERETWPALARRVEAFLAAGAEREGVSGRSVFNVQKGNSFVFAAPSPSPAAERETWPALARRVAALLAAGAEVRRDGPGVTLTVADGGELHLTARGLALLPPALGERLARMAEAT